MTDNIEEPSKFSDDIDEKLQAIVEELAEVGISEKEFVNSLPHPAMFRVKKGMSREEATLKLMTAIKDVLIKRKKKEAQKD